MCLHVVSGPSLAINAGSVWQATAAVHKVMQQISNQRSGSSHGWLSSITLPLLSRHISCCAMPVMLSWSLCDCKSGSKYRSLSATISNHRSVDLLAGPSQNGLDRSRVPCVSLDEQLYLLKLLQ